MPLYEYVCRSCGTPDTQHLPVHERDNPGDCPSPTCTGVLSRRYAAPHVAMIPGTYTRYQQELDANEAARGRRRDKAIREAREREAKADTLRST